MTSTSPALAARIVFSSKPYIALASSVAAAFWVVFNAFDGLLFFTPVLNFYYPIPADAVPGFILSSITAALIGLVVSMNVYLIRNSRIRMSKSSLFSGSALGMASSICASCSSIGFYLVITLGATGVAASTFLSNYQIPLRIIAVALLIWAYYAADRRIVKSCKLDF